MDFSAITAELANAATAVAPPKLGRRLRQGTGGQFAVRAPAPAPPTVALATGDLGGFPYYWQDPATLQFNAETYRWIASAVNGGTAPAQLDGVFTNRFITALGSVSYSLSVADQQQLGAAGAAIQSAQAALLRAWQAAFGPGFPGPGQPIDAVIATIAATWVSPPTDLKGLLAAPNLSAFLSSAPAQAGGILPQLSAYLAAVSAAGSRLGVLSRENGRLQRALAALQAPSVASGATTLNDGSIVPAYVIETPVSAILAGLASSSALDASFVAEDAGAGQARVSFDHGAAAIGALKSFLALETSAGAELLGSAIAAAGRPVPVAARFEGVTRVQLGPMPFDPATMTGWFWTEPIAEAARQNAAGTGGFRFSPQPPFDFSPRGGFGWLTGLVIARYPVLQAEFDDTTAWRIADVVNTDKSAALRLLGHALMLPGLAADYQAKVIPRSGAGPILRLEAPAAAPGVHSRAYVLGGTVRFIGQ